MTRVAVIGSKGSMGRRYCAILKSMGVEYVEFDVDDWQHARETVGITHAIIASPTDTHFEVIDQLKDTILPILCEKPITKDPTELEKILDWPIHITMVNQYKYLVNGAIAGNSYYDYYNTGKDGLEWDCMNIIGLSSEKPNINNESPTWRCMINGVHLNSSAMDGAYIKMLNDWLENPKENREYIKKAHERVRGGYYVKGRYRDSSEDKQHEVARKVPDGNQRQDDVRVGDRSSPEIGELSQQRQLGDKGNGSVVSAGIGSAHREIPPATRLGPDNGSRIRRTKPLSYGDGATETGPHGTDNQ